MDIKVGDVSFPLNYMKLLTTRKLRTLVWISNAIAVWYSCNKSLGCSKCIPRKLTLDSAMASGGDNVAWYERSTLLSVTRMIHLYILFTGVQILNVVFPSTPLSLKGPDKVMSPCMKHVTYMLASRWSVGSVWCHCWHIQSSGSHWPETCSHT